MSLLRSLVVVIPTRNRADLATNAIRSVLGQPDCEVSLLVSDNSTSPEERAELSQFCQQLQDKRLHYITPPEPLPMSQHWDWAVQQALSRYDASHVTILTDRMMFKPGALRSLIAIINAYPDNILSYMHDEVDDFSSPVVIHQLPWTGNLYRVAATRLLTLSSLSVMYDSSVPRMLNCVVPRTLLNMMSQRFGNIFSSIAPDWNFAYRALEMVDFILFYDKAQLVHYAQNRSNGQSMHYGITNQFYAQFRADLGTTRENFAAPFPEIITVWNTIISEYCHMKEATQSPKFPDLDMANYMEALAIGISYIKDPERQQYMRDRLSAHGWKPPEVPDPPPPPPPVPAPRRISLVRRIANRMVREFMRIADYLSRLFQAPRPLADTPEPEETRNEELIAERFSVNEVEFQNREDALAYAFNHPRRKALLSDHETLIEGTRISLPEGLQLDAISSAPERRAGGY